MCQRAEDILAALASFYFGDRFAHQVGDNGALILSTEYLVELGFDVIRNAEIDRGHARIPLLKSSTMPMILGSARQSKCRRNGRFLHITLVHDCITVIMTTCLTMPGSRVRVPLVY